MAGAFGLKQAIAAVAAATMFVAGPAFAEDIRVGLDEAFPIRLQAAAQGLAVGNPSIAGVSVQDDRLLFVTGRSYGVTNLVVVGAEGRLLYSGRVVVAAQEGEGVVTVTRGASTARLSCTPICRPHPDIGDGDASFGSATNQISAHAGAAGRN